MMRVRQGTQLVKGHPGLSGELGVLVVLEALTCEEGVVFVLFLHGGEHEEVV